MDVIARRAFERPDVKADGARCNPREHRSCLARGANWSQDGHDAIAFVQAGALQNSQSPVDTEGDGDGGSMQPSRSRRWSILTTFGKLMTRSAPPMARLVRMPIAWLNVGSA